MARLDRFRPLDPTDMEETVIAMLEANEKHYTGFRVRCVAYADDDLWRNALCVVQAYPDAVRPAEESSRKYERMRLLEAWVDKEAALTLVQGAINGQFEVDGHPVVFIVENAARYTNHLQSNNEHSLYPGREFVTVVQPRGFRDEPHLAYHLPPYPNLDAAMRAWTGLDTHYGTMTARMGFLFLFLPECRARFAESSYVEGKLTLQVPTEVVDLRVKGAWRVNDDPHHFESSVVGGKAEAEVPPEVDELKLYLIGPDETLYDWHSETSSGVSGHRRILGAHHLNLENEAIETGTLAVLSPPKQPTYKPNTAFIIMWMDPEKPELEDVANLYKEVCGSFGIQAYRADDVEHSDVITRVILDSIRDAEFLIVDLTGERPNVYYELGYAHSLGKRPIMYCKEGTPRHFDIAAYNVPSYKNNTGLRKLLRGRLEAMTGRPPSEG